MNIIVYEEGMERLWWMLNESLDKLVNKGTDRKDAEKSRMTVQREYEIHEAKNRKAFVAGQVRTQRGNKGDS